MGEDSSPSQSVVDQKVPNQIALVTCKPLSYLCWAIRRSLPKSKLLNVCVATETDVKKSTPKRQPKFENWCLMIILLSICRYNFCASLFLPTWEIPVNYIAITCFPYNFQVFHPSHLVHTACRSKFGVKRIRSLF